MEVNKKMLHSFKYALRGIKKAYCSEHTLRIMMLCVILIVIASILFNLSALEWILILFCFAGVISLEMINTVLECVVDMITDEYHPLAEEAKDIAAGAVLTFSVFSLIIGLIIFIPHIIRLF